MKINTYKKSSSKKSTVAVIIAVVLILTLAAGSFIYVYAFDGNLFGWTKPNDSSQNNQNDINYDLPTEEQAESGTSIKENSINDNTDSTTSTPSIDISITAASQNDSMLQIRALIPVVTSNGSCTLTLTAGSEVVTKTSEVQALSNASTCKGFDIPTSELSKGTWNIEVKYNNDSQIGTALGKVDIK